MNISLAFGIDVLLLESDEIGLEIKDCMGQGYERYTLWSTGMDLGYKLEILNKHVLNLTGKYPVILDGKVNWKA